MSKTIRTFADVQDFFSQGNVENISIQLSGLQLDSRLVQPGDIFLAIQGLHQHGLTFLASAVQKDRKSTRLNSSHIPLSRMPSSA